jgi:hypothetical protein
MKSRWRPRFSLMFLAGVITAGCGGDGELPSATSAIAPATSSSEVALADASELGTRNFRAHLNGRQQVPQRDVLGQGQAIFQFSKDGEGLHYRINVANVENVIGLHLHNATAGQNGPIGLGFIGDAASPFVADPITVTGTIVEGTATAVDLTATLAGMTLQDLANEMANGMIYVNLHTVQFRPGEIRGQVH